MGWDGLGWVGLGRVGLGWVELVDCLFLFLVCRLSLIVD